MANRVSISHTVRAEGYKYDVFKGELSKGSSISKAVHPVSEVETFKKKLLEHKMLKDMQTHWVLKKNIRTGHLMALNLHFGKLVTESPFKQDIIVTSEEAAELEGKLPEKHICVTDSEIVMKSVRDTLRLSSVNIMEVNEKVFINHGSDSFGQDEAFVLKIFQEYPQINYAVVLAYMPGKKTEYDDYSDTMLPEGIESVHPHYAISWRNNWMLQHADIVVTYITHSWGGAYQFANKAIRQDKDVIKIK